VRFGWGFQGDIPRSAIAGAELSPRRTLLRGVHGWRGRLTINASGRGFVRIRLREPVRVRNIIPVNLRELTVALEDPDAFLSALQR
jgi:hypothetical protein